MKIRKGDTVEIIAGNDKGKRGEVQRVIQGKRRTPTGQYVYDPSRDRVVVAGINLVKKHQRRTGNVRTQFGIIEREAPLHISNVMLVDGQSGKATRVGFEPQPDGSKARVARKSGAPIER